MSLKMLPMLALLAALASAVRADNEPELLSEQASCPNCGAPNEDWKRYRNTAFNHTVWDAGTHAHARLADRAALASDQPIAFQVCSELTEIRDQWGCVNVQIKLNIDVTLAVDLPWLTGEELPLEYHVESIEVSLVTPNGDSHVSEYGWSQPPLYTVPPQLPYPEGHPLLDEPAPSPNPFPFPAPCSVQEPEAVLISLDGRISGGETAAEPLSALGATEDGTVVVRDRVTLRSHHLLVEHQGEHPRNQNYAPRPEIRVRAIEVARQPHMSARGWLALELGRSGYARHLDVLPADAGEVTAELRTAMLRAIDTHFADARRHDHTVYLAFAVEDGVLSFPGSGFVTLPQCCGGGCCPGGGGCGFQCPLP